MGFLKKLGIALLAVIAALCLFVLFCAFNPSFTDKISKALYGENGEGGLIGVDGESQILPGVNPDALPAQSGTANNLIPYTPCNGTITTIPDNVVGRSGLTPVEGTETELSESQAKDVSAGLDKGSDGSDLAFDPEIYPYYAMLDSNGQALYRQIYANACDLVSSFSPCTEIKADAVQYVFEAVFGDHPELFYVQTAYTVKYTGDKKVVEIDMSYYTIANDLDNAREAFEAAATAIEVGARQFPDDYSREKYVHDALIESVSYNAGASLDQSAYSALVLGESVCAGYTRAFQYVCQRLGIPAYYCAGSSGEDHAWNIVKLGDGFYNVDVTWDDSADPSYDYFNRTDGDYAGTHVRKSLSVYLPACEGTQYRNLESSSPAIADADTQTTDDGTGTGYEGYDPYFDPYINNNPATPLDYAAEHPTDVSDNNGSSHNTSNVDHSNAAAQLAVFGLKESDALTTLSDYYTDCRIQMVSCGMGDHCFYNVVPAELYKTIESEYGKGNYRTGYFDSALKTIGASNCNIVIQAERLGGGYYRIWHNIYVW
ncbi:MAG: hypothetical protein J5696_08780 [Lachnospiraceae bacterium]|nr:hypothetical protein [Lachnospiraceae bacterium]